MRRRLAIIGLVMAGVILAGALLLLRPGDAERDVETTRQMLRKEGFKTDLEEFNFSTSPELRNRSVPLTGNGLMRRGPIMEPLDLMAPVGSNTALVLWRLDKLPSLSGEDGWAALRESLDENRSSLDAASDAALSGPLRFDLNAGAGNSMLLRHVAGLRNFSQSFASRAMAELHDQNKNAAWTNVLAATRLATAWETESAEVSQMVRINCADLAFKATWELLQARGWDDEHLAILQREWESADFFKGLPETAAFSRASMVALCQQARKQPPPSGLTPKQLIQSPRYAWANLKSAWQQWRYRHHGTYEDEKALLLYYRDREVLLRQAAQSSSWAEIRRLPGVTNGMPFRSNFASPMQAMIHMRQISMSVQNRGYGSVGLLGRVAEGETRRRVIITAIALERFREKHGSYPKTLAELSPAFLKTVPADFMDGQPLRYRLADDHFLLYSIGLDGIDDGGAPTQPISAQQRYPNLPQWPIGLRRYNGSIMGAPANLEGTDLAWALPASAAEVKAQRDEEQRQENERKAAEEAEAEAGEKDAEARRVAIVQKVLAQLQALSNAPPSSASLAKEPIYQGKPLGELLRNEKVLGASQPPLSELLALKQIITGEEPGKATFEFPLKHDMVTNLGELFLLVDDQRDDEDSDSGFRVGHEQKCERAINGNCLIIWDTTYDAPGQHVLRAEFALARERRPRSVKAIGPVTPYYSSNLCQFSPLYDHYEPTGATLYSKLVEPNGIYSIEIQSTNGDHIRTISGRTTNGIIKERWDLTDDRGKKFANDSFETIYDITLPASGRRQKVK